MKNIFRSGVIWLWITGIVIMLDRVSKVWVQANLIPFDPLEILPIFNLTLSYNRGAAFSFLHNASGWQNMFFGLLAVLVSIFIFIWLQKQSSKERWINIALCLILGGALGNAWDRVLYGYVVDYFDFHINDWHFAIFNVADSAISIGATMLILHWFFFQNREEKISEITELKK